MVSNNLHAYETFDNQFCDTNSSSKIKVPAIAKRQIELFKSQISVKYFICFEFIASLFSTQIDS